MLLKRNWLLWEWIIDEPKCLIKQPTLLPIPTTHCYQMVVWNQDSQHFW
jgi:hypothetical protein